MLGPVARMLATAALSLAVLVTVLSVRALYESRAARARAERAMAAGDLDGAIAELRAAARFTAPVNPYATAALDALERIAAQARARGDNQRALSAQRAIHAAIYAGRSFYTPHEARLKRADRAIADLMAEAPPAEIDVARSKGQRALAYREALAVTRPRELWVASALLGFITWVSGALVFMAYGLDAEGRLVRRIGKRSGLSVVLGWIAFALGLRLS